MLNIASNIFCHNSQVRVGPVSGQLTTEVPWPVDVLEPKFGHHCDWLAISGHSADYKDRYEFLLLSNISFLYAHLKKGRIMPWRCPSVHASVRVSRTFFNMLWDINLKLGTVRCRYNAVNFLINIHKRHPIARPLGRGMGCLCGSSMWIIFCLSSCNYLCNNLQYLTAL